MTNRKEFSEELIAHAVDAFQVLSVSEQVETWYRVDALTHDETVAYLRLQVETLLKERRHLERGARIARDLLAAKDAAVGLPPEERVWLELERVRDV